jgi:hypothetical protein
MVCEVLMDDRKQLPPNEMDLNQLYQIHSSFLPWNIFVLFIFLGLAPLSQPAHISSPEPIITRHPVNRTVSPGSRAVFRVVAEDSGALRYRWYKDGTVISGETSCELIIENAQMKDEGEYHVRIWNAHTRVNSNSAWLRILLPPSITSQPRNVTTTPGGEAKFEIHVEGTPRLNFQWFKNGVPLLKQTSPSLIIKSVKTSDSGTYAVQVSNKAGSVLSKRISLSLSASEPPAASLAQLTFSWSPSSEPEVAKYKFYCKIKGETKYNTKELDKTQITVDGFVRGQTYLFHVTALTSLGIESLPSDSITYTIPLLTAQQDPIAPLSHNSSLETETPPSPIDLIPLSAVENHSPALLFFQNAESYLAAWQWEKSTLQSTSFLNPSHPGDANWTLVRAADLNQNHKLDLVFQHADGAVAIWFMEESGTELEYASSFEHDLPAPDWRLAALADLDANGELDFIFQNLAGHLTVCFSENGRPATIELLAPDHPTDPDWRLVGAGRFREEPGTGLLFQHSDGSLVVWFIEGVNLTEKVYLIPDNPGDPDWRVAALADLDADGSTDLIFQHADGSLAVWFLDQTVLREVEMIQHPGGTWKLSAP